MDQGVLVGVSVDVALLAEGVDRNLTSISTGTNSPVVALLAEGVDRNRLVEFKSRYSAGRPPRGGRG